MGFCVKRKEKHMPKKGFKHSKETKEKMKGRISPNKGIPCPEKTKKKLSIANKGKFTEEKSVHWKGNNAKYGSIHDWVNSKLGKPTRCEHCNKNNLTGRQINWANKDHKYKRNPKDWIRLCLKCHWKYDKKNGLR